MDHLQGSAGRWQTEVLFLLVFGMSWSSQMLEDALFLWFSVLHYCWQGCRPTKAERELHRWVAVDTYYGSSVSTHIMAGPNTLRCLQVSAVLCIVFKLIVAAIKIWSNCLISCRLRSQGLSVICHLDFPPRRASYSLDIGALSYIWLPIILRYSVGFFYNPLIISFMHILKMLM
jgi:hypothetical protein